MGKIPRGDPASTPRKGYQGSSKRGAPLFREAQYGWKVEVTPIGGEAFEVRAEFDGEQLPAFEASRNQTVRRTEVDNYTDAALARGVAAAAVEQLRAGDRDLFLPAIAERLQRR